MMSTKLCEFIPAPGFSVQSKGSGNQYVSFQGCTKDFLMNQSTWIPCKIFSAA